MKLLLFELQETIGSVEGSSTISYVFAINGGSALALQGASSIFRIKSKSQCKAQLEGRNPSRQRRSTLLDSQRMRTNQTKFVKILISFDKFN